MEMIKTIKYFFLNPYFVFNYDHKISHYIYLYNYSGDMIALINLNLIIILNISANHISLLSVVNGFNGNITSN